MNLVRSLKYSWVSGYLSLCFLNPEFWSGAKYKYSDCVCVGEGDGIILPQKCGSYTKASHPAGPEGPEEGGVTTAMAESRKLEMT